MAFKDKSHWNQHRTMLETNKEYETLYYGEYSKAFYAWKRHNESPKCITRLDEAQSKLDKMLQDRLDSGI